MRMTRKTVIYITEARGMIEPDWKRMRRGRKSSKTVLSAR
jgi:hypothetical protein